MSNGVYRILNPKNEKMLGYLPGSEERQGLKARLAELREAAVEIPMIIGGREVRSGRVGRCIIPHDHARVLATYHMAGEAEVRMAVQSALDAGRAWAETPWDHRLAVFLRAAELISGPWRHTLNAATMLGQSKTVCEAEADAACELTDFFRFNSYFLRQILEEQPESVQGILNRMEYRPLEGFVFAVTPFNFTAIGGNLPGAPAVAGNTVVWKPASTAVFSNYYVMKVLEAAGLPDGVINFIPGPGSEVGPAVLAHPMLAGVHFTGSTAVFQEMWRTVAGNLDGYNGYPRLVGETGGKDFAFVHPSAEVDALIPALVAGAFSYQGQKCSATSRVYLPESLWPGVRPRLLEAVAGIRMGDPADFTHYMGAVIDRPAFEKIYGCLRFVRESDKAEIVAGGECDDAGGFFIRPTVIATQDPGFRTMREEIFGPVLTVFVYPDGDLEKALGLCAATSRYALTGAVFARDRAAIVAMERRLRHSAGNLYINDKTTGALVGCQPFGGSRMSGTNDKAGSRLNLLRWLSPRAIKENFNPPRDYRFGLMREA